MTGHSYNALQLASHPFGGGVLAPKTLIELCLFFITHHVERYSSTKIVLPEDLTGRLLTLLIEGKRLNDTTLLPFLHSNLRNLSLK